MNNKLLNCLTAGALVAALALASPALARGGGGGGGGGGMVVAACMAVEVACISAAWAAVCGGGGMHFGGMGGGMHVGGGISEAAASLSQVAASRVRVLRMPDSLHRGRFFHHRLHRFAFIGVPYAYAAYDSCWRRTWTPYGLQWVNVCGDYGYYAAECIATECNTAPC